MAKGILTDIAKEKICKAHAGDITLPQITHIAFGDGGIDESGNEIEPTGKENGLKSELARYEIEKHTYPSKTTCRYTRKLLKIDLVNKSISEFGLYDSEGDLVVYKAFLPKSKGEDEEFIFSIDEIL